MKYISLQWKLLKSLEEDISLPWCNSGIFVFQLAYLLHALNILFSKNDGYADSSLSSSKNISGRIYEVLN